MSGKGGEKSALTLENKEEFNMKWELVGEVIYGEINGAPYIIERGAYFHTHNWYGCELGRIAVRYKTKYGKWRRRHIDESFFRHDEIDVNGKTMDLIEFIKSESAK